MNKYIKLIFIFVITLSLTSCGGTRDFLTNAKKPGGDEFIVEKKPPVLLKGMNSISNTDKTA